MRRIAQRSLRKNDIVLVLHRHSSLQTVTLGVVISPRKMKSFVLSKESVFNERTKKRYTAPIYYTHERGEKFEVHLLGKLVHTKSGYEIKPPREIRKRTRHERCKTQKTQRRRIG